MLQNNPVLLYYKTYTVVYKMSQVTIIHLILSLLCIMQVRRWGRNWCYITLLTIICSMKFLLSRDILLRLLLRTEEKRCYCENHFCLMTVTTYYCEESFLFPEGRSWEAYKKFGRAEVSYIENETFNVFLKHWKNSHCYRYKLNEYYSYRRKYLHSRNDGTK